MTIALGSRYPWRSFSRILPPGTFMRESVILMSDSRICRKESNGYVKDSDVGAKVFVLNEDTAAAYAGTCRVGELCIESIRTKLPSRSEQILSSIWGIAQKTFHETYTTNIRLSPAEAPLYILIGTCNKQGQSQLFHFSYYDNFTPEEVTGLKIVAWPETKDQFENLLNNEVEKRLGGANWYRRSRQHEPEVPPASWLPVIEFEAEKATMLMTAMLKSVIDSASDETIGGMVQCILINSKGLSFPGISYSEDPGKQMADWYRVTAEPHELKTITPISGVLGSYSIIR